MQWKPINTADTLIYKGIAILMIAIHNFMNTFPLPRHNEFRFNRVFFDNFIQLMADEPENAFRWVFAYLGHYGVQAFIFLSAYGLTKKYLKERLFYKEFIVDRFTKLYPPFLLALILWFILKFVWNWYNNSLETADYMFTAVILKMTLLSNFVQGYALKPVGPWWFLPFIFQFYLVFPFLLGVMKKYGAIGILALSLLSLSLVISVDNNAINLFVTLLPYIPGFCFAMYLAEKDSNGIRFSNSLLILVLLVFVFGNFDQWFWYFTHLSSLVLLMFGLQLTKQCLRYIPNLEKVMMYLGLISMHIFLVHGFLRTPTADWALIYDDWYMVNLLCFAFLLISITVSYCFYLLEFRLRMQCSGVFLKIEKK